MYSKILILSSFVARCFQFFRRKQSRVSMTWLPFSYDWRSLDDSRQSGCTVVFSSSRSKNAIALSVLSRKGKDILPRL